MSSSNPTDQFIQQRSRLMETTGGIADNNRRVRLLNFERAMKAQFGPNVVVDPTGTATRRGKVVGNLDAFIKAGGKLQGTPRDTRSELTIRQKENEKLAENYTPPTFGERMDTLFPKAKERISSKTFELQPRAIEIPIEDQSENLPLTQSHIGKIFSSSTPNLIASDELDVTANRCLSREFSPKLDLIHDLTILEI